MRRLLNFIIKLNWKTIFFNFRYFPVKDAVKLPVLVSRKVHLRRAEGNIVIDCPVRHAMIQIGYGDIEIFDKRNARSIWDVAGTIVFKGRVHIGHGTKISVRSSGVLEFGSGTAIAAESVIWAFSQIRIGANCLLSWDILIMDSDHHHIVDERGEAINPPAPIIIGDNVWIGCRSTILKGSTIADNCVIGASSTVTGKLAKENSIYAGSPADFIRGAISWKM